MKKITSPVKPIDLSSISVIVPLWQCAERLQGHFVTIRRLAGCGCSVIWVASESKDGSHILAEEESRRIGSRYILVPRGLYGAWNSGIRASTQLFCYISTVGDSILPDGLAHLLETLKTSGADLVCSPPRMGVDKYSITELKKWPIIKFQKQLKRYDSILVDKLFAIRIQATSGLSCFLGSFASCLSKTSVLKQRPFSDDFNHYGDTAWFCENIKTLKIAYTKNSVASFLFHTGPSRPINHHHVYIFLEQLINSIPEHHYAWARVIIKNYRVRVRYLNRYRGVRPKHFWWLNGKLLLERLKRSFYYICLTTYLGRACFLNSAHFKRTSIRSWFFDRC